MKYARARAVVARWRDVALLSVAGYGIAVVAGLSNAVCGALRGLPAWGAVALVALAVSVGAGAAKGRAPGWLGLPHLLSYPPPWVASVLAIAALGFHASVLGNSSKALACGLGDFAWSAGRNLTFWLSSVGTLGALLTLGWAARVLEARMLALKLGIHATGAKRQLELEQPNIEVLESSFGRLKEWLVTDAPVEKPESVAFGRMEVVGRIREHLEDPARPSVAVIGPVGSGKSTVARVVVYELCRTSGSRITTVVVPVSLWPFETVEAALRGLLVEIDRALARRVNTISLRGLSEEYASAVEAMSGRSLARTLSAPRPPSVILRDYDAAAVAIGIRVVLWVEDLERFAGRAAGEARVSGDSEARLSPVRALLAELASCESLQLVLSMAEADPRFDLQKLVRYVEPLEPLDEYAVLGLLRRFRQGCLEEFPVIDPAAKDARSRLWPDALDRERVEWAQVFGLLSDERALAAVCSTPRTLKQGLRATYNAWKRLYGEVDFDDLLIMSLVRVASPEAFGLVNEHIRELRGGKSIAKGTDKSAFPERLKELFSSRPNVSHEAVSKLLGLVFPRALQEMAGSTPSKPQGFAQDHTDYWARFVGLKRPAEDQSDQRMMRAFLAWKRGEDDSLVRMLGNGDVTRALPACLRALAEPADMVRLIREAVQYEWSRSPSTWSGAMFAPAIEGAWLCTTHVRIKEGDAVPLVQGLVKASVPRCLAVAYSVMHFFVDRDSSVPALVHEGKAVEATFDAMHGAMRAEFIGNPHALIAALRDTPPPTLFWSCWGIRKVRAHEFQQPPFDKWPGFAETVLSAAATAPEVVLPQLSFFVVRVDDYFSEPGDGKRLRSRHVFDEALAARLFDVERLKAVFSRAPSLTLTEDTQPFYDAVIAAVSRGSPAGEILASIREG